MVRGILSTLRFVFGNVWSFVCVAAAASCIALSAQLLLEVPPFDTLPPGTRLLLGVPALFGAAASLYGLIAGFVLGARERRSERMQRQLRSLQRRSQQLEALRIRQQARLDQLSTLREVATVVNQESDFSIIAEKTLELIEGLLEPLECTIFLMNEQTEKLSAFAQRCDGKFLGGNRVRGLSIPALRLSDFERHSVLCRVHGQELHAVVPLKVEEKILGVLLLVFPTDSRPEQAQTAGFNRTLRPVLLEITHHISLAVKTKHLHTRAVVDGLTRLYTRSHFDDQIQAAVELARRSGDPFSLILADIDHFKKINDSYGHATGDIVLSRVASRMQNSLRKYDTAYRYGGEELAVILPRTRLPEASSIAERLRGVVEAQRFRGADNRLVEATVSLGVAQFKEEDEGESVLERADQRLYHAKHAGRNRVCPAAA